LIRGLETLWIGVKVDTATRFEVILNDHDPYFNYQATKYLSQEGISEFRDWSATPFNISGSGTTRIYDFCVIVGLMKRAGILLVVLLVELFTLG
jgi:hypothetical protein